MKKIHIISTLSGGAFLVSGLLNSVYAQSYKVTITNNANNQLWCQVADPNVSKQCGREKSATYRPIFVGQTFSVEGKCEGKINSFRIYCDVQKPSGKRVYGFIKIVQNNSSIEVKEINFKSPTRMEYKQNLKAN